MKGLPTGYDDRKQNYPLWDFMFGYFPLAWLEVVKVAVEGNKQHNPGERLHWARGKSMDQLNTAARHQFDHGMGEIKDTDGCYHLAKAIWRLSAELQLIREKEINDTRGARKKQSGRAAKKRKGVLPQARPKRARRTRSRLPRLLAGTGIRDRNQGAR